MNRYFAHDQQFVRVVFIYKKHCVYEYLGRKQPIVNATSIWKFCRAFEYTPDLKAQMLIKGTGRICP
jgi:hypothetical protein